jgi:antitoxin ParD1/3/4
MPTRNVVLTEHHEKVIESLVGSGRYQNASEVLREGLRLVEQREATETAKLEALRRAAEVGWLDVDAGRYEEVAENEIADWVAEIGRHASDQVRSRG